MTDSLTGSEKCQVAVFQIGARRHYAVPRGLAASGSLAILVTDAYADVPPWSMLQYLHPRQMCGDGMQRLGARQAPGLDPRLVETLWWFCLQSRLGRLRRRNGESLVDFWVRQNRAFGEASCGRIPRKTAAVYAFNGAALEIFREAKRRGMKCILDQTAAAWRFNTRLLTSEQQRWPGWEHAPGDLDPSGKMIQREEEEWELADRIICGSRFVADSIAEVGGVSEKCRVVEYPTPPAPPAACRVQVTDPAQATRILFVGTLQLRKGIQYLWDAARQLDTRRFTFRVIGPSNLTATAERRLADYIECLGPVARHDVWRHYTWAQVLALPTLSEGSANVCHEALASGLPVITTAAAGVCSERHGVTVVPSGDASALAEVIARQSFRSSSTLLSSKSAGPRSVDEYGAELASAIET